MDAVRAFGHGRCGGETDLGRERLLASLPGETPHEPIARKSWRASSVTADETLGLAVCAWGDLILRPWDVRRKARRADSRTERDASSACSGWMGSRGRGVRAPSSCERTEARRTTQFARAELVLLTVNV